MHEFLFNNLIVRFLKNVVGPAAIVAAGMIGAGAVSTRLLAGAWFGFDPLWVALYVIPMVIFTLDSCSRIGIMSGDKGVMELIKSEIHPALAWFIFFPTALLSFVANMGQMSVMVDAAYGTIGKQVPPGGVATTGMVFTMLILVSIVLILVLFGGYKRIEKLMTGLLLVILICFIIVAVKGLMDWRTWIGLVKGLIPKIPEDLEVVGSEIYRSGFTQVISIAGQALPSTVLLAYGYFTLNAEYTESDIKSSFWKSVLNFGLIWGLFSVVVVVAGTTALHYVYRGDGSLHYSQIDNVYDAGRVITPALPVCINFLAPRIFSLGLLAAAFTTTISIAMIMVYFTLDIAGKNWKFGKDNKLFQWTLGLWIAIPAIISPFWTLPSLIKAIITMAGGLIMTPIVILIIIYFINKKAFMGKFTAHFGRNFILGITFLFSLYLVVYGAMRIF